MDTTQTTGDETGAGPHGWSILKYGESHPLAKLKAADVPAIRSAYAAGERSPSIAARYGVAAITVRNVLNGKTWAHVPGGPAVTMGTPGNYVQGDARPNAKLSPAKVAEARRLYRAGATVENVAARIGITKSTTGRLLRGKSWAHVADPEGPVVMRSRWGSGYRQRG